MSDDTTITPDLYTGEAPVESANKVWKTVQRDLGYAIGANVHKAWTGKLTLVGADAYSVTLQAPSRFIATKIEGNYLDVLHRLWEKHERVEPPRRVVLARPSQGGSAKSVPSTMRPGFKPGYAKPAARLQTPSVPVKSVLPRVQKTAPSARARFTFDNFVVGPSNEFAFAVARQVTHGEAAQYNPIVLHGSNGMGKTHLLYATKDALEARFPHKRVHLLSGENFVSLFVNSMRSGSRDEIENFKASLRDVDVLIIDDAHFITTKPGSQEELLHTLVALFDEGKQVLLATDRHPDQMEQASERLKSYMTSGLVCKISQADYELRVRILDRLITRRRETGNTALTIPQSARDLLAARINATPRDLEGAFNQVVAQSEFLGTPITVESVQNALSESRHVTGQRLTVDRIQRVVAEEFSISLQDMVSKRRARVVARPRQIAMYLAKTLTRRSLPDIGRRFGGRDHTTVMHAVKRIKELSETDADFAARVQAIESRLKG